MVLSNKAMLELGIIKLKIPKHIESVIRELNDKYTNVNQIIYTLPREATLIRDDYIGMLALVNRETDMGVAAKQRKVRNLWDRLWSIYHKCHSDVDITLLKEFGVKLARIDKSDNISCDIVKYYNDIILWYIDLQSKDNLIILRNLVEMDNKEFRDWIRKEDFYG